MGGIFSVRETVSPGTYALAAPALLFSQHAVVAFSFWISGHRLDPGAAFWLLPLRQLAWAKDLPIAVVAFAFAICLAVTWLLAALSFRRAAYAHWGYWLAALTIVPAVQIAAVLLLALLHRDDTPPPDADSRAPWGQRLQDADVDVRSRNALQGLVAGVGVIVLAVLISALTFGAYGFGLFVLTPLLVGITTGYMANRGTSLSSDRTAALVILASALGGMALVMLALEGLVCIILASPLAIVIALIGGGIGRSYAISARGEDSPVMCVALLPMVFACEAVLPPAATIITNQSIIVAAPPEAVWKALTSDDPIATPPGLIGLSGLAYPIRGRILGEAVGGERQGQFSTGVARERITAWEPARRLSFTVLSQPPAMEEMSPYRRVHAPHVSGYFETGETSFELQPMPSGATRISVRASHVLRIDPIPYWEPLARWAVRKNTGRVLQDIQDKAEATSSLGNATKIARHDRLDLR
jgi:uncharacterized protein YndB with AHSA1/START domain